MRAILCILLLSSSLLQVGYSQVRYNDLTVGLGDSSRIEYQLSNSSASPSFINGKVGIGTTVPQEKLEVNGNIRTKRLIVTQEDWPDYIFNKDYPLPSLDFIEKYIERYHHLPGIVPQEEIQTKGLDIGRNAAGLLKKIEELTLYVIDQNKKIEQQKGDIKLLQQEFDQLQKDSRR